MPAAQRATTLTGRLDWRTDGAQWPHQAHSHFVQAGGCHWHVQVHPQAPPKAHAQTRAAVPPQTRTPGPGPGLPGEPAGPVLWLLHGTGASGHSWRALVPLLSRWATLVVPDLPGHGFSTALLPARSPRVASMRGMAQALGALADVLALPPTLIVGHSAGAALAACAVLDQRLPPPAHLVGINAALLPFQGLAGQVFGPMARLMAHAPLLPWLVARSASRRTAVQRLVEATGSQLDAEGVALYARLMRSPDQVAGALAMMAQWDLAGLWPRLPQLAVPLTLLVGSRDGTVPPAQAQRVCQHLPAARRVVLDGLGHLAHEEAPARLAGLVAELMAGAMAEAIPTTLSPDPTAALPPFAVS